MNHAGLWLTLAALGAYHGLNPAMGWLFAVSQGMQQRERRAALRALVPIAIGHELSIVLVAVVVLGAAAVVSAQTLHVAAAAARLAFGIFRDDSAPQNLAFGRPASALLALAGDRHHPARHARRERVRPPVVDRHARAPAALQRRGRSRRRAGALGDLQALGRAGGGR